MKILLRNSIASKLFTKQLTFEALHQYILTEYENPKTYELTFQDQDGDNITITSQDDIQIMKQIFSGKQFIKLNLIIQSQQNKAQMIQKKQKKNNAAKKEKGSKQKKNSKEKKPKSPKGEEIVKKQVSEKVQDIVDTKTHSGIKCNQCKVFPIVGVRYSCMNCEDFNLCEQCQKTTQHEHDFIKMRKPRRQQSLRKNFNQWKKMGRGFLRQNFKKNAITSQSEFQKSKQKKTGPWGRGGQMVIKRRTNRLSKIYGGQPEAYLDFVKKTLELELQDVICTYAKQNNINLEEKIKDNFERKLQKLSFFFNKSVDEYKDLVQANPQLHFRAIIRLLKEKGLQDYNGQNFKQMREKLLEIKNQKRQQKLAVKKQKQERKAEKIQKSEQNPKQQTPQKPTEKIKKQRPIKNAQKAKKEELKIEKSQGSQEIIKSNQKIEETLAQNQNKGLQMRQKGKILIEMKDLFGAQRSKEYFKFIEKNFSLGRQAIIEKWIDQKQSQ